MENYLAEVQHAHRHMASGHRKRMYVKRPTGYPTPELMVNHLGIFKKIGKGLKKLSQNKVFKGIVSGGASVLVDNRKKIAKGLQQAGKFVLKTIQEGTTLALVGPFLPLMKKALAGKGYKGGNDPLKIIEAFYTTIVKAKHYESYDCYDYNNADTVTDVGNAVGKSGIPFTSMIPPIISFIKGIMGQKKSNPKAIAKDPTLAIIANGGEAVAADLNQKAAESGTDVTAGTPGNDPSQDTAGTGAKVGGGFSLKSPMVIGAIIVVIIIVVMSMKK